MVGQGRGRAARARQGDGSVDSKHGAKAVIGAGSCRRAVAPRLPVVALAALVLLVQGCGEEGSDRPLVPQKGTYQGRADQPLDQEQLEALRQRAREQPQM